MPGEVLVAIMNSWDDFHILREQLWYRIPVERAPRRWPPKWLAFYQTKAFGEEAYAIQYYGRVVEKRIVKRRVLFPREIPNPKSEREYYRVRLESLEQLPKPIRSGRPRRIVFVPTTWSKFRLAESINDLFDDSPLEDRLWSKLKELRISAERQWELITEGPRYLLDFAVFCAKGNLDVETDGHIWHSNPNGASRDRTRDNTLASVGWHVLRFDSSQIRESLTEYCVPEIAKTIGTLGGPSEEALAPRKLYSTPDGIVQQLSLFEESVEYDLD